MRRKIGTAVLASTVPLLLLALASPAQAAIHEQVAPPTAAGVESVPSTMAGS